MSIDGNELVWYLKKQLDVSPENTHQDIVLNWIDFIASLDYDDYGDIIDALETIRAEYSDVVDFALEEMHC